MSRLTPHRGASEPDPDERQAFEAMLREPLGRQLDDLGVSHVPRADEQVQAAVVLLKVTDDDDNVSLRAVWSPGLSWLERIGMLREAERAETTRHLGLDD